MVNLKSFMTLGNVTLIDIAEGGWQLRIGDPTLVGWTITIGYFAVFLLCLWTIKRESRAPLPGAAGQGQLFWGAVAGLILLLGINKQLDLQIWLASVGKSWAQSRGIFEHMKLAHVLYIFSVVGAALIIAGGFFWITRRLSRRHYLALAGIGLLVSFVSIRALAYFSSVDEMLGWRAGGVSSGWLLELSGIICVGISTFCGRGSAATSQDDI